MSDENPVIARITAPSHRREGLSGSLSLAGDFFLLFAGTAAAGDGSSRSLFAIIIARAIDTALAATPTRFAPVAPRGGMRMNPQAVAPSAAPAVLAAYSEPALRPGRLAS